MLQPRKIYSVYKYARKYIKYMSCFTITGMIAVNLLWIHGECKYGQGYQCQ